MPRRFVPELRRDRVVLGECVLRPLLDEEVGRLGQRAYDDEQQDAGHDGAEDERGAPSEVGDQDSGDRAAQRDAGRKSGPVDTQCEATSPVTAVLRDQDVQARHEATDAQSGEGPKGDQLLETARDSGQAHSDGDEGQACDGHRPAPHPVGERGEEECSHRHPDQAGTEKVPDLDGIEVPVLAQVRRDERHDQNFEAVHHAEEKADRDRLDLIPPHRSGPDRFADVHDCGLSGQLRPRRSPNGAREQPMGLSVGCGPTGKDGFRRLERHGAKGRSPAFGNDYTRGARCRRGSGTLTEQPG